MLCLEWYAGSGTARRCRTTRSALSAACRYRSTLIGYGLGNDRAKQQGNSLETG